MPSRIGVVAIVLFWLATTTYVGYHEVWPRYFSDAPPPIQIDLADEATKDLSTNWQIYRGEQRIGKLTTRMEYNAIDDTFHFLNTYSQLTFDLSKGFSLEVPRLETSVRVNRAGELREQKMTGDLIAKIGPLPIGDASAEVSGYVLNGELLGRCQVRYPIKSTAPVIDRELEPVPVPAGQVLNPMMPLNRLRDVQPGRRWVIRIVDPLQDAMNVLLREMAKESKFTLSALPNPGNRELLAEVKRTPEKLDRKNAPPIECWVIEYRGDEVQARTWVSTADGRVMRQEASGLGEKLRFDRDE